MSINHHLTDLDPETRGYTLASSETLRKVHNSFARNDPFVLEGTSRQPSDDVYHFVTYVPIGEELFELDGLQPAPISHGNFIKNVEKQKNFPFPRSLIGVPEWEIGWTVKAREVLERRMEAQGGVGFNLMAIVSFFID
jgi:ubiquitin carboxyl-terminal hydrolase L5